jgi:pimeloyl-ACP methyl ester carboxylesterase
MHIECWGRGAPTVVFDSGHGVQPFGWYGSMTVVSEQVRACVYSRLGIGRSDPPPRPHTPIDMAMELGELLAASGEAPPFVLVGHSLGGINIRLYAREHREDVAGFVFVDPSHEDQFRDLEAVLPGALQQMGGATQHESVEGMTFEAFEAGLEAVREGNRSLGDVPVVVLNAALEETVAFVLSAPDEASKRLVRAKHERYARLAALSPNSVQVMARKSGHMIPFDQPDLVARAVLEVVRVVREKGRVRAARIEEP